MANELSMDEAFLKQLDAIVETHLEDEQFGVEELAKELGLSRSQLHRKLDGLTGKSTSQYIREYRLEKAMEMLQNNVATASEIAYQVGFGSPTYFNSSFNKYYGYPPGEVKLRTTLNTKNEEEAQIQVLNQLTDNITIKRRFYNLRTFIIGILALLLVVFFGYYNYANSGATITEENKESVGVNEHSIAVLPFKNMSGSPDNEAFCDGMTTAIISRLSKIKDIEKVISQTSVMTYKDQQKTMPEIADELKVHYILESGFQKSGNNIKIYLRLIDAPNDNQLWSDEYSGVWNSDDIFKIQSEVAEDVAKHMDVEITDPEMISINESPTTNNEAYNLYLLAQYQYSKGNEISFRNAIPLYEKAIALDSSFVDAYAGLGQIWIYSGLIWGIFDEQVAWSKAKTLLKKAYELDPTNIEVANELYRGYFYYDWNFVATENYLKKVFENHGFDGPKYASFNDYFLKTGRPDRAYLTIRYQSKDMPTESWSYISEAWDAYYSGKKEQSHQIISSYASMFVDDLDYLREASKLYYYLGDYKNSKKQLELIINNFSDRPPIIIWLSAVLANIDGNGKDSQKYLDQLYQQYNDNTSGSPAWFIALYYCHTKDNKKVFEWLQKSYEHHEVEMLWLREEPLLRPLRTDHRYIKLYNKIGFSEIE